MELAKSELFDKFTILKLKKERLPASDLVSRQYLMFDKEVKSALKKQPKTVKSQLKRKLVELYETNKAIWELEHDLRSGLDNNMSLEEIGKRAIKIRNYNGLRMQTKNKICLLFKEEIFREVKTDHISEK